ncbi:MAG: phosphoribosylglycinamide formyltransferase [Planctomycetes bacterium]|nr:phosphoribosylglycinamide formyltransferase [Planctomycetota bacterium]
MRNIINLAVLISGSGRTLQNFIDLIAKGELPAKIQMVISSKPNVVGLDRARKHNIPAFTVNRKEFKSSEEFSDAINKVLKNYPIDLITMAGFLNLYKIPPEYERKVMNIHPALLPAFGGKGFYTDKVHEAVIAAGAKFTGCTVHFADNVYDKGPIILQRKIPVLASDTPHSLADRVFAEELIAYPEAIRLFAERRIKIENDKVIILK